MSTAAAVPETWELSGDDAWETLTTTGRLRLAADAFRRFRAADGTSHARSMAFLSIMIVIQGVVVVLGLASAIGQGNLTNLIVRTLQSAAPGPAGKLLTQAVDQAHQAGASDRSTALILGLVAVLVSGTILMGQLERGLNRIYGIEQDRSTVSKYLHAFVLTITAGLLIAAAFIALGVGRSVTGSLGSKTSVQVWDVIRWPLGLVLAIAAVALLYRWAPRRRQPAWSWLGFGSFVAVGVWTLSTIALSWFFRFSSSFGQTYGPLAGIIALGIWAFLASVGVLYGGAVAAQLEAVRAGAPAPRARATSAVVRSAPPLPSSATPRV
jgi:YihY family inner membrane protein